MKDLVDHVLNEATLGLLAIKIAERLPSHTEIKIKSGTVRVQQRLQAPADFGVLVTVASNRGNHRVDNQQANITHFQQLPPQGFHIPRRVKGTTFTAIENTIDKEDAPHVRPARYQARNEGVPCIILPGPDRHAPRRQPSRP